MNGSIDKNDSPELTPTVWKRYTAAKSLIVKNLIIEGLEESLRIATIVAEFGKTPSQMDKEYLLETGLLNGRVVGCMKWLWFQWLSNGSPELVREQVTKFVQRGIEEQKFSPQFHERPRHDLLLLQCAIFASSQSQLIALANQVVDASGFRSFTPHNNGDLYASAWCGVFKYWILGDFERAAKQAEIVWAAYRPAWLKSASKPLTTPWLKRDWKAFVKAQQKDFERIWSSGRKNGTVRKETETDVTVTVRSYPVEQVWCWAHCGMAILAHRQGVEIATDPFWLPPHALKCAPSDK